MRYCEDFRFYEAPDNPTDFGNATCARPRDPQGIEWVSRAAIRPDAFCDVERGGVGANSCGRNAEFFKSKFVDPVAA
jgi:hypothetical protein